METINTVTSEVQSVNIIQKNKMPIIGFICMLATPIVLFLSGSYTELFGYSIVTDIILWIAAILPVAGLVVGVRSLFRKKEIGKLGYALAIVTVIMCNPLFCLIYFVIVVMVSRDFAGLPSM